jgi:myo-inositol 2-dehydrogenase/D-chiro-inositol 1-dehydrogenase
MRKLRVGIVGAGGIAPVHAAGWSALGASLQVFSHEGAEKLAARFPVTVAPSLGELMSAVDIVDIVTPSATHRPLALAAIAAGRHVVCEKPLGTTVADAAEIVSAAAAAGVRVLPAHVVRYFPEYGAIREQIAAGRIGRLGILRLTRAGAAPRGKPWFFDERQGGGLVRDFTIHDLDQAVWMAGDVVEVFGTQNPPTVDGVAPAPVVAHVVLTHANGALSEIHSRWGAPGTRFRTTVAAFGEDGMLQHDSAAPGTSRIELLAGPGGDPGYVPESAGVVSPYELEFRDFARAIAGGGPARVSPSDGVVAVALAVAVLRSIESGQPVRFDADEVRSSWPAEEAAVAR